MKSNLVKNCTAVVLSLTMIAAMPGLGFHEALAGNTEMPVSKVTLNLAGPAEIVTPCGASEISSIFRNSTMENLQDLCSTLFGTVVPQKDTTVYYSNGWVATYHAGVTDSTIYYPNGQAAT